MNCTEAYREHIMYTFNGFCKVVICHAALNAWRNRSRRRQKEISFEYLTEEKFYPLGTTDFISHERRNRDYHLHWLWYMQFANVRTR